MLILAQAAVLGAAGWMLWRMALFGLAKRFPFLSAYTAVTAALVVDSLVARILIQYAASKEARITLMRRQFYVWLAFTLAEAVLALIVVLELNSRFLDPYPALRKVADRALQGGLIVVSIGVLIGVLTGPEALIRTMRGFSHFGGVLLATALLLLCGLVVIFTRHFRLEATRNLKTALIGVGALFGSMVVWETAAGIASTISPESLGVVQAGILAVAFVWLGWRFSPQEDRALAVVPVSSNSALERLEALNEMMSRPFES